MSGEYKQYLSADSVDIGDNIHDVYTMEYLNSIVVNSLPLHKLKLKVGSPIILLRNINPTKGLCNGTRLIVKHLGNYVIEAEILGGKFAGQTTFIPRIPCSSKNSGLPFEMRRKQFPIALAYSMTINKAQGQTIKYVGLNLTQPVFSHGQLYVALSRVTQASNIKVLLSNTSNTHLGLTKNVVYNEVFE